MKQETENKDLTSSKGASNDFFATTRWTVVLKAKESDTTRAQTALGELCQTYWYPLYAYVRHRGYSSHDAEDLTQGFFARLLRLHSLSEINREKGKFRAFLIASLKHYLADEWDKAIAQKRSVQRTFSLDAQKAEDRYLNEPADKLTPEILFERQWVLTLLEKVVQRLQDEYTSSNRELLFMKLRFVIGSDKSAVPYSKLAKELDMSAEAVRVVVHRLRQRYRQILREEISHTVANESEITDELNYFRSVLSF